MGNYRLYGVAVDGGRVFDAERWGPDDWRFTGPDWSGMMIANRTGVMKMLADHIAQGKLVAIDGPPRDKSKAPWGVPDYGRMSVDGLGGAVIDGKYTPFHEWAEFVVTKEYADG